MPVSKSRLIRHGLRFSCRRCGRCCAAKDSLVLVNKQELQAMAAYLKVGVPDFMKKFTEKADGFVSIMSRPNGTCVFYQDGCTIYPVRPIQCRTFPFWSDVVKSPHRWQEQAKKCKGMNKGKIWDVETVREQLHLYSMNLMTIMAEKDS